MKFFKDKETGKWIVSHIVIVIVAVVACVGIGAYAYKEYKASQPIIKEDYDGGKTITLSQEKLGGKSLRLPSEFPDSLEQLVIGNVAMYEIHVDPDGNADEVMIMCLTKEKPEDVYDKYKDILGDDFNYHDDEIGYTCSGMYKDFDTSIYMTNEKLKGYYTIMITLNS